ncbi:hypothetical protein Y032_0101g3374 [Ancylostoma ceylanicum]|uniref:Uncharacterized protein n=1 Tax=Ancylostoma ceylanicum TaxID=53326 RepID=A0A016THT9_9BILA|nr:hypothetical protein Y032_0101g3374 [Ancylostoma ceylanicum]
MAVAFPRPRKHHRAAHDAVVAAYKKRSSKPAINWDLFTTLAGFWEDTVVDNIDEEYERLILRNTRRDFANRKTKMTALRRLDGTISSSRRVMDCKVPSQWKASRTVLLYKKGDPQDIGNYRRICLLSVV